jgi:hypothetical protein
MLGRTSRISTGVVLLLACLAGGSRADLIPHTEVSYTRDEVEWASFPDNNYPNGGDKIANGEIGPDAWADGKNVAWANAEKVTFTFDLIQVRDRINRIDVDYNVSTQVAIHAPTLVTIDFSDDGVTYGPDTLFSGFDDSPGPFSGDARTVSIDVWDSGRYVRMDFDSPYTYIFLSEVSFSVPEPSVLGVLALGAVAIVGRRIRA